MPRPRKEPANRCFPRPRPSLPDTRVPGRQHAAGWSGPQSPNPAARIADGETEAQGGCIIEQQHQNLRGLGVGTAGRDVDQAGQTLPFPHSQMGLNRGPLYGKAICLLYIGPSSF